MLDIQSQHIALILFYESYLAWSGQHMDGSGLICREGARTKTCTLLTDVAAKDLTFHWGDASAWRAPNSGLPVRTHHTEGIRV